MTTTNQTLETLSVDQLAPVTGGGIGTTIGGLFGAKGQKWGAMADNIFGMFKGMGGGGGGSGSSGGGGGGSGMLGNLGKLFGGFGGGSSGSSGGSAAPADAGGGGQ